MNVRPCIGSAVPACAIHSFLGGADKQLGNYGGRRPDHPGSFAGARDGTGRTASGAKRSLKIAGEARVAHELLTDNLFDLAGAQRG